MPRKKDLTGQQFGDWLVLEYIGHKYDKSHTYYQCKNLRTGELRERRTDKIQGNLHTRTVNTNTYDYLLRQRFGFLTVIEITNKSNNNWNRIIKCQCDCGNIIELPFHNLLNNGALSCGCMKSKGEYKIIQLLQKNHILYETQKTFNDCRFEDTGALAKFDFFINNDYLVEYDGVQHFEEGYGYFEGKLESIQERDNFKTRWCQNNNIPLIRIPYTRFDKLCIEDLLLETSNYLICS